MRDDFKQFIERNIDDIDQSNWTEPMDDWYYNIMSPSFIDSDADLKELFNVLSVAFPNIEQDTLQARRAVIERHMRLRLHSAILRKQPMEFETIKEQLFQLMCLDEQQLKDIYTIARKQVGV